MRRMTVFLGLAISLGLIMGSQLSYGASYPFNINKLYEPLDGNTNDFLDPASVSIFGGTLTGLFDVLYLGYEAGHTDYLTDGAYPAGNIVMQNQVPSDQIWDGVYNIANLFLTDTSDAVPTNVPVTTTQDFATGGVQILQLTQDWIIPVSFGGNSYGALAGLNLVAGDFIIGFGDGLGDSDYDDLIFAARAVPVPAAFWLLASGLMGLMGVRRFKRS